MYYAKTVTSFLHFLQKQYCITCWKPVIPKPAMRDHLSYVTTLWWFRGRLSSQVLLYTCDRYTTCPDLSQTCHIYHIIILSGFVKEFWHDVVISSDDIEFDNVLFQFEIWPALRRWQSGATYLENRLFGFVFLTGFHIISNEQKQ